jgi:class 3 adenylate cyclase/tetratricopeptide (TPR) repeat protein
MIPTETATVVFTDLVRSTESSIRLGHGAYETLRRSHFESLRLAASVHGGSEIKSTGDGLVFAFRSAGGAVESMIRMQRAADWAARRSGKQFRMRIGASAGETNRDDNDIFGISVIEAARLCAAASADQILVTDLLRGLIRGLGHKLTPIGALALKGLPEPILTYAVEWNPREDSDGVIELPSRVSHLPAIGFYGRAKEQAIIERCWLQAKQGRRQVVLLSGEPGIGKTRLGFEAGRNAHNQGAIVLLGTCDENINRPYRPFVEALKHYLTHAPDEILLQHVREYQGELLRIAPSLAMRVPSLPKPQTADADTERYQMFEAVTGLLATASEDRPIVLILDDLQWAATPELLLLKHIVHSATPMHLLIIATYRDTEVPPASPFAALLADLHREVGIERIALCGLDEDGVAKFVTAAFGQELNETQLAFVREIRRDTKGSPLFVGEILRNFIEAGAAFEKQCAEESGLHSYGIPDGVKEAIGRRLSRLSAEANKILRIASVIGHEFEVNVLQQVTELPEENILDALDEAKSAALVSEPTGNTDCYAFTHILMRTTLYETFNPTRRARMHERVGVALEQLPSGEQDQRIDELARHWLAAAPVGGVTKAIRFARQAGDQSLAGLAFEQAAKYYEQALSLLTQHDRDAEVLRCDLLIALGDARMRAGDARFSAAVDEAVRIARCLGDVKRFARAVLGYSRPEDPFAYANVVDGGFIALYEEAIGLLGKDDDKVLLARLYCNLSSEMFHTTLLERRKELSRQAVDLARQCGDRELLAQALHFHASAINNPTNLEERLSLSAEQIGLADEAASLETHWAAAYQRVGALLELGDIRGTEETLARMKDLASKLRQPFFSWATGLAVAMISIMRGAPSGEEEAAAAFRFAPDGKQATTCYIAQLSVIRRDQGRQAELVESVRGCAEALSHLPVWRLVLAGLYCETNQLDEARNQINLIDSSGFEIPMEWTWASVVVNLAQICAELDLPDLAALYYPRVQPVAGQVGVTGFVLACYGSLAFPCGQLAACLKRWEEAENYFKLAEATNERIGARPYLVRTWRAYAAMLLDRNKPDDKSLAAKLIAQAQAEADLLGMRREIERLDQLNHRWSQP